MGLDEVQLAYNATQFCKDCGYFLCTCTLNLDEDALINAATPFCKCGKFDCTFCSYCNNDPCLKCNCCDVCVYDCVCGENKCLKCAMVS